MWQFSYTIASDISTSRGVARTLNGFSGYTNEVLAWTQCSRLLHCTMIYYVLFMHHAEVMDLDPAH